MSKDIVDRLRSGQPMGPDDVRFDAAREIERLREENECLEAMKAGVEIRIADLNAEIERLRGLVKSAYMEGFTSSKPWRDEDDLWNASRAKMEIEKEVYGDDF